MTTGDQIEMGNDEFILYIRKHHPQNKTLNNQLGKRIWHWLREQNPPAQKVTGERGDACLWGPLRPSRHSRRPISREPARSRKTGASPPRPASERPPDIDPLHRGA